jgi:hypothetical protein
MSSLNIWPYATYRKGLGREFYSLTPPPLLHPSWYVVKYTCLNYTPSRLFTLCFNPIFHTKWVENHALVWHWYSKSNKTCFRYQVYLYVSGTITNLKPILRVVTETSLWGYTLHSQTFVQCFVHQTACPTKPTLPNLYKQHYLCNSEITLVWLNCHHLC